MRVRHTSRQNKQDATFDVALRIRFNGLIVCLYLVPVLFINNYSVVPVYKLSCRGNFLNENIHRPQFKIRNYEN